MTSIFLLKLLLVPALIYLVTIAGRKWGPGVAGWLSAFPIVSGPILLVISLEQGSHFGATAAAATLLAVVAILVFSVTYAWASARGSVFFSMCCALAAYALSVWGLRSLELPLGVSFLLVLFALVLAPGAFPNVSTGERELRSQQGQSDLPWRMMAGAALVLFVTFTAAHVGARTSGFLAMFPIMSTVLVGFSHVKSGRAFAVTLLRGMVFGYFSFATFCLVVSYLLPIHSIASAFLIALLCAIAVQLTVRRLMSSPQGCPLNFGVRLQNEMRRGLPAIVLGLILGTIAIFPMFVSAVGHDSTSIFVALAHSEAINWPFLLADFILPASASRSVSGLGLAIHYGFYTFLAWLLLLFLCRGVSRAAACK